MNNLFFLFVPFISAAFEGAEVVFHMAAPNSSINNYQLHYSVNVEGKSVKPRLFLLFYYTNFNSFYQTEIFLLEGTKNVIDACVELKVKRLIYTSSPSVVFDGVHGIHNGNETLPYPPSVPTFSNSDFI